MKKIYFILLLQLAGFSLSAKAKPVTMPAGSTEFITTWDLSKTGSGSTQITFGVAVGGAVNYTWETIPSGTSGSGTIANSSTSVTITGLPASAVVRLIIGNTNFRAFKMDNGDDKARLTAIEQWGTAQWRNMLSAFYGCNNLNITATDLPDLSRVSNMANMFRGCTSLTGPSNMGSWDTSNITNMSAMFRDATVFNQNIGTWNTAAVTNMLSMFYSAAAFNQNIGSWNTSAVTNMQTMFRGATAFNQNISFNQIASTWNTEKVTDMSGMFREAVAFNQEIGNWKMAAVTDISSMFYNAALFNGDLGDWNTSSVISMGSTFYNAAAFNQDIGGWITSAVTDMSAMFSGATSFNQDITNWNTAAVTTMKSMFRNADVFNQDIGDWVTSAVTDMSFMFRDGSFNQDIGGWNTSVVTDMSMMFRNADSFNQDIGDWNTAAVTDMSYMFYNAGAFNQNLGDWELNQNVILTEMLSGSEMGCGNYSGTLIGWAVNAPSGRTLGATGLEFGTNANVSRTTLISTKGWTITDNGTTGGECTVLPVTLISFSAREAEKKAALKWQTTSEVGASHFEVERSADARSFEKIGQVTAVGNSNVLNTYTLSDELAGFVAPLVYYRLRSVDADGSFEVSRVIVLKRSETEESVLVYPNPVGKGEYATVEAASLSQVAVFDMLGRKVSVPVIKKESGKAEVNMRGMLSGMYLFVVTTQSGTVKKLLVRD